MLGGRIIDGERSEWTDEGRDGVGVGVGVGVDGEGAGDSDGDGGGSVEAKATWCESTRCWDVWAGRMGESQ